jgi:hypothetical protein
MYTDQLNHTPMYNSAQLKHAAVYNTVLLDEQITNGGDTSSSPALQIASHGRIFGKKIKNIYTGLARSYDDH